MTQARTIPTAQERFDRDTARYEKAKGRPATAEERARIGLPPEPQLNGHGATTEARGMDFPQQAAGPYTEDGVHLLDRYVAHTDKVPPREYVMDRILVAGLAIIAGVWGIGKTEALVSLYTLPAWLCEPSHPLRPLLRRHVVYIAEDTPQVMEVLHATRLRLAAAGCDIPRSEFEAWFHVVDAHRMSVQDMLLVARAYTDKFTSKNLRLDGTPYFAKPVVVIDTKAALIAEDDERDNSEASRNIAQLRQHETHLPWHIVAHTTKAELTRRAFKPEDLFEITPRGASSQGADVQQTLLFFADDLNSEARYLRLGKKRFHTPVQELVFTRHTYSVDAEDVLGNPERVTVACSSVRVDSERISALAPLKPSSEGVQRQLWQLLDSELAQGRRYSKNTLYAKAGEVGVGRNEVDRSISLMAESGRVVPWQRPDWQDHNSNDRTYMHPVGTSAPAEHHGTPLRVVAAQKEAVKAAQRAARKRGNGRGDTPADTPDVLKK